jgi:hypothetical protein
MAPPWWSYLWDCCVGVYGTFFTIPTVESYGAGVFCSRQNLIAVKLFKWTITWFLATITAIKIGGVGEQMHLWRGPFRWPWWCGSAIPQASPDEGGPELS